MSTPGCWTSGLWSLRISSCGFKTPGVRIFAAAASEHAYNREGPQPIPQTTVSVRVRGEQADGRVSRHEWWGLLSGEAPSPRELQQGPDAPPCASKAGSVGSSASQGHQSPAKSRHPAGTAPAQRGWVGRAASAQAEGVPPPGPPPPPRLAILEQGQGIALQL